MPTLIVSINSLFWTFTQYACVCGCRSYGCYLWRGRGGLLCDLLLNVTTLINYFVYISSWKFCVGNCKLCVNTKFNSWQPTEWSTNTCFWSTNRTCVFLRAIAHIRRDRYYRCNPPKVDQGQDQSQFWYYAWLGEHVDPQVHQPRSQAFSILVAEAGIM